MFNFITVHNSLLLCHKHNWLRHVITLWVIILSFCCSWKQKSKLEFWDLTSRESAMYMCDTSTREEIWHNALWYPISVHVVHSNCSLLPCWEYVKALLALISFEIIKSPWGLRDASITSNLCLQGVLSLVFLTTHHHLPILVWTKVWNLSFRATFLTIIGIEMRKHFFVLKFVFSS